MGVSCPHHAAFQVRLYREKLDAWDLNSPDRDEDDKLLKPLYLPLDAGSARLTFTTRAGTPSIYAQWTAADTDIDENLSSPGRHQHSHWCIVNANDGTITKSGRGPEGHNFDMRVLVHEEEFVSMTLSDSFAVVLDKPFQSPGGSVHLKNTVLRNQLGIYTRSKKNGNDMSVELGDLKLGDNGYVALLTSEKQHQLGVTRPNLTSCGFPRRATNNKDLVLVHIKDDYETVNGWEDYVQTRREKERYMTFEPELVNQIFTYESNRNVSEQQLICDQSTASSNNYVHEIRRPPVVWLTNYDSSKECAARPKLIKLGSNKFIVIWEKWVDNAYNSTWTMMVDEYGNILQGMKEISILGTGSAIPSGKVRLNRGDDAFTLGRGASSKAAWITGFRFEHYGQSFSALALHTIDQNLEYTADLFNLNPTLMAQAEQQARLNNIALNQPTYSSKTFINDTGITFPSERATNGILEGGFSSHLTVNTIAGKEPYPYWYVELREVTQAIKEIKVYASPDPGVKHMTNEFNGCKVFLTNTAPDPNLIGAERERELENNKVWSSGSLSGFSVDRKTSETIPVGNNTSARYLVVMKPNVSSHSRVILAEVEVIPEL